MKEHESMELLETPDATSIEDIVTPNAGRQPTHDETEAVVQGCNRQDDNDESEEHQQRPMSSPPTASSWWLAIEERRKSRIATSRNRWVAILMGQGIALVATSMNAASFTLSYHSKVETQLFQLFIMYLFLSIHLLLREEKVVMEGPYLLPCTKIRLQIPWWIYLMMSILDVIPNFLQLVSLHYTSLTSTTLLGSLTVPSTMFFSSRILARSFGKHHFLGVLLCVTGGALTVWVDHGAEVHSGIGDLLAMLSALIYGLGDVVSEYCVKNVDRYEFLGMLGLFGAVFTGLTFPWIEEEALSHVLQDRSRQEQVEILGILGWYTASVLLYYMTEAFFLMSSDATLLNLSMQTSNLWAILFSFLAYHVLPPLLFYPALILVVVGVCVYKLKPTTGVETDNGEPAELHPFSSSTNTYSAIRPSEYVV